MAEPTVFLNGAFLPRSEAKIDIEDRGFLFADGVYEVTCYCDGRAFRMGDHIERLTTSMQAMRLPVGEVPRTLAQVSDELIARNGLTDAKVYWQVTRGVAPRGHGFPKDTAPTVLAMASPLTIGRPGDEPKALRAVTVEDRRWLRVWAKTIMLLDNVLARQAALDAGAHEAIFVRDDVVKEGSATSLFIVRRGEMRTHPTDGSILPSITRKVVLELAAKLGIAVTEEPFALEDVLAADEAVLVGTTTHVAAVVEVDGQVIHDGQTGPVTRRLFEALMAAMRRHEGT